MTNDIIMGVSDTKWGSSTLGKQVKMRQLTVSQNQIKTEFVKIAKDEYDTAIGKTTVHSMLSKPEFGRFKLLPQS